MVKLLSAWEVTKKPQKDGQNHIIFEHETNHPIAPPQQYFDMKVYKEELDCVRTMIESISLKFIQYCWLCDLSV